MLLQFRVIGLERQSFLLDLHGLLIIPIHKVRFRQGIDELPLFPLGKIHGALSVVQGGLGVAKLLVIARGIEPCQVVMSFREVRLQAQGLLVIA